MNIKRIPRNHKKKINNITKQAVYCTSYAYGTVTDYDIKDIELYINDQLNKECQLYVNYDNNTAIIKQHMHAEVIIQLGNSKYI